METILTSKNARLLTQAGLNARVIDLEKETARMLALGAVARGCHAEGNTNGSLASMAEGIRKVAPKVLARLRKILPQ